MTIKDLKIGEYGIIEHIHGEKELRHHLLDMGLVPGTTLKLMKRAPLGDPIEIRIRGYELTLREDDAKHIYITQIEEPVMEKIEEQARLGSISHPGVGEDESYPTRRTGREVPNDEVLRFALLGNQNCGKTTLFNQLTGSNQHVGNFPGVTVSQKDGVIKGYPKTLVTDLPGIYSLNPYSNEEIVTRDFLLKNRPHGIINILDATNIERNLYLTLQLAELNIPMVLALNMMDEVRENGMTICVNALEAALGIPVVPISAAKNEGIAELVEHAVSMARHRDRPGRKDFCDKNGEESEQAVHRCIHGLVHLIDDHAKAIKLPRYFAATRLAEEDSQIKDMLQLDKNELDTLEHILLQMEEESGMDRVAAVVNSRFCFIDRLCSKTVRRPRESKEHQRSLRIDRILTGKHTAVPSFFIIMAIVFWLTFGVLGTFLGDLLGSGIDWLTEVVSNGLLEYGMNPVVHSLIIDGVFAGVGSVLSFLPIIVVLFFFLSLLEDSGYMARIAFVMDKPLRKIGLSGRSFVPMLIGFGCSVPAIMATRTLSSERDRKMTILLTPFMSCSAKLPIYAFFTAAFFPKYHVLVIMSMYVMGIVVGIFFAIVLRMARFKGQPIPFVMELPNYRFPSFKTVLHLMWDKAKDFLTKAFTIIFLASIIVWFLQTFDMRMNVVTDSSNSLLAALGGLVAPIFAPLGFGDWRASTALITGLVAKESVVSTLNVLLQGGKDAIYTMFQPITAFAFLVFTLYYTPCVAAIAAVKREMNSLKTTALVVLVQCAIAWVLSYMVVLVGRLITLFV